MPVDAGLLGGEVDGKKPWVTASRRASLRGVGKVGSGPGRCGAHSAHARCLRPRSARANQQNAAVQAVGVAAPPEARGPSGPACAQSAETVIAQEGTGRDAARVIGQLLSPMVRAKTSASSRSSATIGFEATRLDDLIAAEIQTLAALKTHQQGLMQQLFPSPEAVEV